jgi:SAM-dependent methyltransferase
MTGPTPFRHCPTCGATERRLLYAQRFESLANVSLLCGYDVVTCDGCGLVFADRIPPDEAFGRYYAEASKYEFSHSSGVQHEAELLRLDTLAGRIAELAPTSSRLLDVGCATGELLVALREYGYTDLTGLDPSAECVRYAREAHELTMIQGVLGARPLDVEPFEIVVLSAVLEHVPALHPFLEFVKQWLISDGLLVIEVPDAERFATAVNAPYQEFSVEHINFFSAAALDNLLGPHGWTRIATYQQLCNAGGNMTAPVLTAMFRHGAMPIAHARETESEIGVRDYLETCRAQVEIELKVIGRLVESQVPVLIWGVGTLCQRLLANTPLNQANIRAFVDSNPHYHGSSLIGRPVLAPSDLQGRTEAILVLSWGFFEAIRLQIRDELQLGNDIIRIDRTTAED